MQQPPYSNYPSGQPPYGSQSPGGTPYPGAGTPGYGANPYASPYQSSSPYSGGPQGPAPLAGRGQRFLNFFIDNIVLNVLQLACLCPLGAVIGLTVEDPSALDSPETELMFNLLGYGVFFVVFFLYYVVLELAFQRTLGKLLTGTRVVQTDGTPPTFGQVLGRTAARLIPFEALSFLFMDRGWHDTLSGTQVVRTR